ncbi:MAG: type II toxin-antitoxin system RelE/ParE family toxin [Gammaproteobacteria bacterium]|nr:type II toxin-antitoxin system RelE/ParE family toxin [Gammaproteobacteria bacterium]
MEKYKLLFRASAKKELRDIPVTKDRLAIIQRLDGLSTIPRPPSSTKLKGQPFYRLRCGHYRIIYDIDKKYPSHTHPSH